jgi:hypothetical protein
MAQGVQGRKLDGRLSYLQKKIGQKLASRRLVPGAEKTHHLKLKRSCTSSMTTMPIAPAF